MRFKQRSQRGDTAQMIFSACAPIIPQELKRSIRENITIHQVVKNPLVVSVLLVGIINRETLSSLNSSLGKVS